MCAFSGATALSTRTPAPRRASKSWKQIYNNTHTADPDINRRWDGQYPSLWITGGGTFVGIWTPSTFAQAGLYISEHFHARRIYELSSEHHVRNEVVLDHASNWQIYALQTEEERGEGGFALPLDIRDSSHITFANLHMYRVVSSYQPFPYAIKITPRRNIHFRNVHCYSDSKVSFDNAVYDQTHDIEIRQREFAWLDVSGNRHRPPPKTFCRILAEGAKVGETSPAVSTIFPGERWTSAGNVYFVDAHWQKITAGRLPIMNYRWSVIIRSIRYNYFSIRRAI